MENVNKYSFEELYNQLYEKNFSELEGLRNERKSKTTKYFPWITMILFGFFGAGICSSFGIPEETYVYWALFAFIILGFLSMMILFGKGITKWTKEYNILDEKGNINEANLKAGIKKSQPYKYVFKEKIIKPIVECAVEGSLYTPDKGLNEQEYYKVWEKADVFSSEDEIIMNLDLTNKGSGKLQLIMSEVLTQDEEIDDGERTYVTRFHGLAGYVHLPKNVGAYIKVMRDKNKLFKKSKDNVQMDMQEFEKIFDVETNDKIKAVQIFTSDIMTEFVDIVKSFDVEFEIYINYNILHMRFHTGEMFEPQMFGKSMQFEKLKKYYDMVIAIKYITEKICNTINELDI